MSEEVRETFSLEQYYQTQVSEQAVKDATAFRTVPGGSYRLTPEKVEPVLAGIKSPWPGRPMLHVTWAAESIVDIVREDGSTYKPKCKMFADLSLEDRYDDTPNGKKLDKPAALFNQAAKAFGLVQKSKGEIFDGLKAYPLNGYITEVAVFKGAGEGHKNDGTPKDKYLTIRDSAGRAAAAKDGADFSNFLQNVSEAK